MICTFLPAELAQQLHVVVARDAQRRAGSTMFRTIRSESRTRGPRSTRSPTKTALRPAGWRRPVRHQPVASRRPSPRSRAAEQLLQLVAAAVDVADDVERAVVVAAVVPERLALDRRRRRRPRALSTKTWRKPRGRALERSARGLARCWRIDVRPELAVGPLAVALVADPLGQVEHDRHRQAVVLCAPARPAACAPPAGRSWRRRPSAGRARAAWRR